MTPLQIVLINSNLMIMHVGESDRNQLDSFDIETLDSFGLFKSQKRQIIINAQNSRFIVPKKHIIEMPRKSINGYNFEGFKTIEDLKNEPKFFEMKIKKLKSPSSKLNPKPNLLEKDKKACLKAVDKERWIPLRDRSYYKSKDQYKSQLKRLL